MRITACLVIYNEEKVIQRCLDSLNGVVDEIIIVHDGTCRDQTLSICRGYTDKIFVREHLGVCEPHRQFSINKATGEWILIIDADEFLSESLRAIIKTLVNNKYVDAYSFLWDVRTNGKLIRKGYFGNAYRTVLFRKNKLEWYNGDILSFPKTTGETRRIGLKLHHIPGYDNFSLETFKTKWLKWCRIHAKRTVKSGRANLPAFMYLIKAPLSFFYHISTLIIRKSLLSESGLKITLLLSAYYFALNGYIFQEKTNAKH